MRISLFTSSLLLATALFAASTLADAGTPVCSLSTTPYTATYFGSYKGWRIETTQQLEQRHKGEWRFSIHADNLLGSILEKSFFTVTPAGNINSREYSYQRKLLMNKNQQVTIFDWQKKRAITTGDKTGDTPLSGGELDNLNYQLQLRCDLLNGKNDFFYPVVDRDEVDPLEFKIVGEEILETSLGKLNTVVVKRVRNNNNRITTLWFAKDMDYVMVKLLQEERKDTEAYLLYIDTLKK